MNNNNNDFSKLNSELLRNSQSILSQWLPNGQLRGREYVCGNLHGSAGDSLSINIDKGVWKDFASGDGGSDLISLYAAIKGLTQIQAYNELSGRKTKAQKEVRKKVTYKYNEDYSIQRVEYTDGTKSFYAKYQGKNSHAPAPRPLYWIEKFDEKKPFLIVEGEKSAHAAIEFCGDIYNVVTSPAGSNSFSKADWESLARLNPKIKNALIWPDCDVSGFKYAAGVASILKKLGFEVNILDVRKNNLLPQKEGWDAADFLNLNYSRQEFIEWGRSCKTSVIEAPKEEKEEPKKEKKQADLGPVMPPPTPKEIEKIQEPKKSLVDASNPSHIQDLQLAQSSSGKIFGTLANAMIILKEHPLFRGRFFYDTFFQKVFLLDNDKLRPIRDTDVLYITSYCQSSGAILITKNLVADAIEAVAFENQISQPKMEIESYVWDGTPRVNNFFTDYFVSDYPTEYLEAVARNFWISMVARIFKPGVKVDTMVVLESKSEGIYKSTALRYLAGQYFSETNGVAGTKEFLENTKGYYLIEDDELVSITALGAQKQRSFLSRQSDTFRKAYGRFSAEQLRQYVIVGTTNDDSYLDSKSSDNRRFYPVKVTKVNLDKIKEDREQLFAEARERFLKGEGWWDVPKDIHRDITSSKNLAVNAADPWEEIIEDYFNKAKDWQHGYFKTKDVLLKIMMKPEKDITRKDSLRVSSCLRTLGYEYANIRDGSTFKAWTKGALDKPFQFSKEDSPSSSGNVY